MAITISCALIVATTVFLWAPKVDAPNSSHLIFIYLLPIAAVAIIFGSFEGLAAGALATLLGSYFLYDPLYTLYFSDLRDLGEVVLFLVLALLGTKCVSEIRRS